MTEKEKEKLKSEEDQLRRNAKKMISFSKVIVAVPDILLALTVIMFFYVATCTIKILIKDPSSTAYEILTAFGVVIAAECVFAGIAHTAYSNKEKFQNCMNIRFSFIERLIRFKMRSGLYTKEELKMQIDGEIEAAESETSADISGKAQEAEATQENISI